MDLGFDDPRLLLLYFGVPLLLLALALISGLVIGRGWDRSLKQREAELYGVVATNLKTLPGFDAELVGTCVGACVGCIDRFRTLTGGLRLIVGGEVPGWTRILARARREAHVRMLEEAARLGATHVLNVRLQTATLVPVSERRGGVLPVEFVAYGTAVRARPVEGEA